MLEKTGNLVLTEDEFLETKAGKLPPRILNEWGLSLSDLQAIITSGKYSTIGKESINDADNFETNY